MLDVRYHKLDHGDNRDTSVLLDQVPRYVEFSGVQVSLTGIACHTTNHKYRTAAITVHPCTWTPHGHACLIEGGSYVRRDIPRFHSASQHFKARHVPDSQYHRCPTIAENLNLPSKKGKNRRNVMSVVDEFYRKIHNASAERTVASVCCRDSASMGVRRWKWSMSWRFV